MVRRISIGWRSVRIGLRLVEWASQIIGYVFMFNAAIMCALTPSVYGNQFFRFAGIGVLMLMAMVFLALLRRAFHIDSDTTREQAIFVGTFLLCWLMTVTYSAPAEMILVVLGRLTPWLLCGCGVLGLVGFFYCLTAIGNPLNWLLALAAFVTLSSATALLAYAEVPDRVAELMPDGIENSAVGQNPLLASVGLGGLAVFLHGLYLRRLAVYFKDPTTADFITSFLGFHLFASVGFVGLFWLFSRHTIKPVLTIGEITLDAYSITLSIIGSMLAAISGFWLARCIDAARHIIDLSRRKRA